MEEIKEWKCKFWKKKKSGSACFVAVTVVSVERRGTRNEEGYPWWKDEKEKEKRKIYKNYRSDEIPSQISGWETVFKCHL